jgi:hypothetical protein
MSKPANRTSRSPSMQRYRLNPIRNPNQTPSNTISLSLHPPTIIRKSVHHSSPTLIPSATNNNLQTLSTNSLHNTPPLLLLLRLQAQTHHLAIIPHSGSRLVHVALEGPVEPAAHEAGRVARHLGVAGAALTVVLAAALVGGEVVEEALGGG